MSDDEIKHEVRQLKKAVFGDMDDPKKTPGIIAELSAMNASLQEIRDAMRKINLTILSGLIMALLTMLFRVKIP